MQNANGEIFRGNDRQAARVRNRAQNVPDALVSSPTWSVEHTRRQFEKLGAGAMSNSFSGSDVHENRLYNNNGRSQTATNVSKQAFKFDSYAHNNDLSMFNLRICFFYKVLYAYNCKFQINRTVDDVAAVTRLATGSGRRNSYLRRRLLSQQRLQTLRLFYRSSSSRRFRIRRRYLCSRSSDRHHHRHRRHRRRRSNSRRRRPQMFVPF